MNKLLVLILLVAVLSGQSAMALIGKTAEPDGMVMGNLTSSTTWEWLLKDEDGSFHPTGQVVDMDAYDSYTLLKRTLVLNHKEVELEMDDMGTIIGFHSPSGGANGGVFLGALILLAMLSVVIVVITQNRRQPRRKGSALGAMYFLSLFLGDDHVKRG